MIASEALQHTGSFKYRAAINVVLSSDSNHFATVSSGNFGQALAYACKTQNRKCTILMPETSAQVKIDAVRDFGANIELVDVTQKGRSEWLAEFLAKSDEPIQSVSPYDEDEVIEGNSTLGEELAKYAYQFNSVVVPIGGGGLSSGVVTGLKRKGINKLVIGAEPAMANDASQSLRKGKLIKLDHEPMTIADGVRTLSLGQKNWDILKTGLSEVIEVEEEQIEIAVKLYFEKANLKVEPTGALSLAAVISNKDKFIDKKPLCIISGGNVDPHLYAKLISKS